MPPIRNSPRSHRVRLLLFVLEHIIKIFILLFIRAIIEAEEIVTETQPLSRRRFTTTEYEEEESGSAEIFKWGKPLLQDIKIHFEVRKERLNSYQFAQIH